MKTIPFNCFNTLTPSIVTALNKDRVSLSETAFHFTKKKNKQKKISLVKHCTMVNSCYPYVVHKQMINPKGNIFSSYGRAGKLTLQQSGDAKI